MDEKRNKLYKQLYLYRGTICILRSTDIIRLIYISKSENINVLYCNNTCRYNNEESISYYVNKVIDMTDYNLIPVNYGMQELFKTFIKELYNEENII